VTGHPASLLSPKASGVCPATHRTNLATLGEGNFATFGEYPALVFEGRELTDVDQQRAGNPLASAVSGPQGGAI